MLQDALLFDGAGRPVAGQGRTYSRDWDEVQDFCRKVYMPYKVRPTGRLLQPDATMRQAAVARVTVTRFSYGVPIHLSEFDPGAGNILVLNTLRGSLRHLCEGPNDAVTRAGDSFVVDCSRTDYWLDGDENHMQLNLTIPHDVVAEVAHRWFDFVPDDRLWTKRLAFGGYGSRWQYLLSYVVQAVDPVRGRVRSDALARHLEEMLCLELLETWAAGAGVSLKDGARAAAPYYVREAEEIMAREARDPPAIGAIAVRVGVSARTLSEGFQRFRGISPRSFLRARRLEGFRTALERAQPGETVTTIATDWGYVNFGALAVAYRERFGERPSQTLARTMAKV
ncbi:AraC family transcriptional regulator [Zavarzinia compransoris]|uniref:AraC family transcriptional regulator n=1 Tax=Zavarzinia compransoris TaxID=1264899 RepID=A0A317ED01_9PROT|nr:helix-turn-helix domain-containing protein [Zavarzinia compransoris]PWR24020.1 AraC family transcriptional regulator [Zavarzinia compransoris]TDP48280.1 AraC-like DNA-binding protein [Zavarzinia compransoris]